MYQPKFWNVRLPGMFQKEPPQHVTLQDMDCFELKATLAVGSRETCILPLTTWKNLNRGLAHNKSFAEIAPFDLSVGPGKLPITEQEFSLQRPGKPPRHLTPSLALKVFLFYFIFKSQKLLLQTNELQQSDTQWARWGYR